MIFKERDLEKLFAPPPKQRRKGLWPHADHRSWWRERLDDEGDKDQTVDYASHNADADETVILHLKPRKKISSALRLAILAIIMFVVFNGPSLFLNFKWWYVTDYQNHSWPRYASSSPSNQDNVLLINKIGVSTPIVWNANGDNYAQAMTQGIVALNDEARPDTKGLLILAGYSNDHWWHKNPYGQVFALLPYLVVGDSITIKNNGREFTYIVSAVTKDGSLPDLINNKSQLLLVTSHPLWSSRRIFVTAQKITDSGTLPST